MAAIQDQAIVLRRLDFSESSQVLAFLTRGNGPQRLIAKGVRRGTKKRFATGIDLLERGRIVFLKGSRPDGLGTMTEWQQSELYLGLRGTLRSWYAAQYAAEISAGMTEQEDPHPEVFDALAALLEGLNAGAEPLPLLVAYQRVLLGAAGLWPDLTRCVSCNRPAPPGRTGYYSAQQGGLLCRDCEAAHVEKRKVSGIVLDALRMERSPAEQAPPCFELLDYTITHALGRPPALSRMVWQVACGGPPGAPSPGASPG